jgi:hypothetical protein
MTYLLDTDTCIGMLRGKAPKTIAKPGGIAPLRREDWQL